MRRTSTTSMWTVQPSSLRSSPVTPSDCLPVSSRRSRAADTATWLARVGGRASALAPVLRPLLDELSRFLAGLLLVDFLLVDFLLVDFLLVDFLLADFLLVDFLLADSLAGLFLVAVFLVADFFAAIAQRLPARLRAAISRSTRASSHAVASSSVSSPAARRLSTCSSC